MEPRNSPTQPSYLAMQLSFSTADIERSVFYEPEHAVTTPAEPLGDAVLLVVHGEMAQLDLSAALPQPAVPLSPEAGLLHLPDDVHQ